MSFLVKYKEYKNFNFNKFFDTITAYHVYRVLNKNQLNELDFLTLLSPIATQYIEAIAHRARKLTIQNFGKTILLYTPIYLSNYCINKCVYCSFNCENNIIRKQLNMHEVDSEAQFVHKMGIEHVLLLTGDAPERASMHYLLKCIEIIKKYFSMIGLEIYALSKEHYEQFFKNGVNLITIYQETYNHNLYKSLHLYGPKQNYYFRLDAPERACQAGMREVNIGALLGLDDWRRDTFFTGLHANFLQNKYNGTVISISMPRIRSNFKHFQPQNIVSDKNFVQCLLAYRLYLPRFGITISTRENAKFRNNIIQLGVTKMSAGSSTIVGGYTSKKGDRQFNILDIRNVEQIKKAIKKYGYQPILKDWEKI